MTATIDHAPREGGVAPGDDGYHPHWCDPRECYRDDFNGGVYHRTTPTVYQGGTPGEVRVAASMFVADWSGDTGAIEVTFDRLDSIPLSQLEEFDEWLWTARRTIEKAVMPPAPVDAPCPHWCTASESADERTRREHEWDAPLNMRRYRIHHGLAPSGKSYRSQYEFQAFDGSLSLSRILSAGRVREVTP